MEHKRMGNKYNYRELVSVLVRENLADRRSIKPRRLKKTKRIATAIIAAVGAIPQQKTSRKQQTENGSIPKVHNNVTYSIIYDR